MYAHLHYPYKQNQLGLVDTAWTGVYTEPRFATNNMIIDNLSNLSLETCMSIVVLLRTVDVELCVRLDDLLVDNNTGSFSTASSTTESTGERASTSTA